VDHVGFENPGGRRSLVVSNSGAAKTVTLQQGSKIAEIALLPDAVTTLSWS
jgi:hypothetical protein